MERSDWARSSELPHLHSGVSDSFLSFSLIQMLAHIKLQNLNIQNWSFFAPDLNLFYIFGCYSAFKQKKIA